MFKFEIPINPRLISFVQIQFSHNFATFGAISASFLETQNYPWKLAAADGASCSEPTDQFLYFQHITTLYR